MCKKTVVSKKKQVSTSLTPFNKHNSIANNNNYFKSSGVIYSY